MTVEGLRAQLDSQIAEPVITEGIDPGRAPG